jgi:hypothetical protein
VQHEDGHLSEGGPFALECANGDVVEIGMTDDHGWGGWYATGSRNANYLARTGVEDAVILRGGETIHVEGRFTEQAPGRYVSVDESPRLHLGTIAERARRYAWFCVKAGIIAEASVAALVGSIWLGDLADTHAPWSTPTRLLGVLGGALLFSFGVVAICWTRTTPTFVRNRDGEIYRLEGRVRVLEGVVDAPDGGAPCVLWCEHLPWAAARSEGVPFVLERAGGERYAVFMEKDEGWRGCSVDGGRRNFVDPPDSRRGSEFVILRDGDEVTLAGTFTRRGPLQAGYRDDPGQMAEVVVARTLYVTLDNPRRARRRWLSRVFWISFIFSAGSLLLGVVLR